MLQLLHPTKDEKLDLEFVKKQLNKYTSSNADIDEIISEDSEYNFGRQLSEEFVTKIGSNKYPQVSYELVLLIQWLSFILIEAHSNHNTVTAVIFIVIMLFRLKLIPPGIDKRRATRWRRSVSRDVISGAFRGSSGDRSVATHGPTAARGLPRRTFRHWRCSQLSYEAVTHYAQVEKLI